MEAHEKASVHEKTTLPMIDGRWLGIGNEEGEDQNTMVLELEHGWLVYRESSTGAAMTFVPRQAKPADAEK